MPRLTAAELALNPSVDPIEYPGDAINRDTLIVQEWLYPVSTRRGRTLADAETLIDGGPLKHIYTNYSAYPSLAASLDALSVAPISERYPVLAIGSNASPAQLLHKYAPQRALSVIPVTVASVKNLGTAHSAHISKAGYMPYAPRLETGAGRLERLCTLWLDVDQMKRMDETEPNYTLVTVSPGSFASKFGATLNSGEELVAYSFYRSKWGVFSCGSSVASPATTQESIFDALLSLAWFRELIPNPTASIRSIIDALAADENLRLAVRAAISANGQLVSDGLPDQTSWPIAYSEGAGEWAMGRKC